MTTIATRRPNLIGFLLLALVTLLYPVHASANASGLHADYPGRPLHTHDLAAATPPATPPATVDAAKYPKPDLTRLPLGDAKSSTTTAKAGTIFLCRARNPNEPGAGKDGPWIKKDGTFDLSAKVTVDGAVAWPSNKITMTLDGNTRRITSNGLPAHTTGIYPIGSKDDAYQFDRNPNSVKAQTVSIDLPTNPTVADKPACVGGGIGVGIMLSGVVLNDGLDAPGRDAVAHEVQDTCQGHPEKTGTYHYHNVSSCLFKSIEAESGLVGYAIDGFGIYGPRDPSGKLITNADLDECHGRVSEIMWDGKLVTMYHYHATYEFPYSVGCFRGTPIRQQPPPR